MTSVKLIKKSQQLGRKMKQPETLFRTKLGLNCVMSRATTIKAKRRDYVEEREDKIKH